MKRFLQKSYSWLATLLLAVAFAVSGNVAAQGIELPFAFTVSSGGTVDGVGFYMWTANWYDSTELYGEGDASATWGTVNLTSPAKNIVKVELTCRTNSWSGVGSAAAAAATVCETENLGGSFTTNGAVAIWQGSAHKLTFSSTDDIDVYKMVVYLEEGEVVKECTVGVDHYADNCKPGKHETPFSRYITLYMQENAATSTWTGSDNCPEGVTLTNEAGQQFRVAQFNTWKNSDQLGVQFENEISTPGVYTLHIPEGLVAFESGKFNKEIDVVWTIVEPDLRPTKDIVFDFTDGTYTNDGTLSYTKDGVVFTLNENRYNATAQGFRIGNDGWVSFAAPEKATIKSIQLLQESSYGVSPDFTANVGETHVYDRTLYWAGDDASVTLTDNYGTCYFTKAIVTLAVEESEEPVVPEVDPAEEAYAAWKTLVTTDMKAVKDEWDTAPETDVPGKKPAAVVKAVMAYYNSTSWLFGPMGFGDNWAAAKEYYAGYGTTIEANYAEASTIWQLYLDAELVPVVVEPSDKDKYTIKLSGTDYYFTTTEVKDNNVTTYSISATPEYFYIEPSNGGYTIKSADTDKWVGYDVISSWDFSNDEKVWAINSLEGEPTLILKNGSKGFGVDDRFEGAGVYTDKSGQYWVIEKFEEGGEVVDPVDPVDPVEPTDLSIFAGEWYFKGEGAYLNYYEEEMTPKAEYVVNVTADGGKLYMTDLIGFVYDDPNAFIGTYDAQAETLTFNTPYTTCYVVDDNYEYYTNFKPLVFNVVKDEEGNVSLVNTTGWDFMYEDWYYTTYACGYTSCVMTREQQIVEPEPEGWTGEIIYPETVASIDELLNYTIEFEEAKEVEASGYDVLGVIFDEAGDPYAIALANGVFDSFGSISFEKGKATVNFMKISDLTANAQAAAKVAAARIGGFTQPAGQASVVFAGKSFKVDGELVYDIIQKDYTFEGGSVTGIETIATNSNDSIYDLSGRRVNDVRSGLYIKNGVKVLVK